MKHFNLLHLDLCLRISYLINETEHLPNQIYTLIRQASCTIKN
jgi:hypothetical protein